MSILFYGGYVLVTNQDGCSVLENVYLGVENDKICYMSPEKPQKEFTEKKDMHGKILMPGLYNCHTHSPMVLLRGVGSDLPLDEWLFGKVCPIEDKLTKADIEAGSNLALLEMISGGTVSFSDMYFEPQITAEAAAKAGMRANICRPVQSFDTSEKPENSYRIKQSVELYKEFNGVADGRILIDFCIHAEYTCNENITRYYSDICNSFGGNMHIHLSETLKEHNECISKYGKTPAQWFESLGAFNSRAFAAHCVTLSDGDIEILKSHNVSVVHNPTSNMKLGSGFAPIEKYRKAGLNVTLGTDGAASNNNLDMLEEMHLAGIIHKGYLRDAAAVKADEVLKMATINGAALQGRKGCGKLEVGCKADIIAVSTERAHMRPALDKKALLVYSAQDSDVAMTMCDGKILYENGEYKTLDSEKIFCQVKKIAERLYK